ncbi:MAG: site-specific DNA-methyltransferase [Myxococcota bacterium]|nr:site-specific DNA-methyltransferase [Myxococcota bacterium]
MGCLYTPFPFYPYAAMSQQWKPAPSPPKGNPNMELSWRGKKQPDSFILPPTFLAEEYSPSSSGNNRLYWGENKEILAHLLRTHRGAFHLIYLDPPFDSSATYKKKIKPIGQKGFDFYEEEQYSDYWYQEHYLQFIYERLILLKDLLHEEGSIYLHCDWHQAGALRLLMDEVFGPENFLNEIIWHHDFGGRSKHFLARKHDNLFLYKKGKKWYFDLNALPDLPYKGKLHEYRGVKKTGKKPTAMWDIAYENKMSLKNTGYPTQKPEELLRRIIGLSSREGDLILDCFCGSGTTLAVAQRMNRRFIGSDNNRDAIETTRNRLLGNAPRTALQVYQQFSVPHFRSPLHAYPLILEKIRAQPQKRPPYQGVSASWNVFIAAPCRALQSEDLLPLIDRLSQHPAEKVLLVANHLDRCENEIKKLTSQYKIRTQELSSLLFPSSTASIERDGRQIIIRAFSPTLLREKLSSKRPKETLPDWKTLIQSVLIDPYYDGQTIRPTVVDIANPKKTITGEYTIPTDASNIAVVISDILAERFFFVSAKT